MIRLARKSLKIVPLVIRTALISAMLAAPVVAVPMASGGSGLTLEQPVAKKTGMGLVLMVSLQRA
jgi:hypothetical protein